MLTSNKRIFKIGIISGSSQVASSVALYYKNYSQHEITCFIRSAYSQVFFDLLNIPYENVDLNNKEELKSKLKNFDIILDFSYPAGQVGDIPKKIQKNLDSIIGSVGSNAVFINMSSIMAYGMPDDENKLRDYKIPRASYGYIKRKSETMTEAIGKKHGIRVYNFRLGQVHGFLQSVNGSFREKLSSTETAYLNGEPTDPTNTIFISSLGEAILNCVDQNYKAGTYTLVSNPQWTLKELYDYYLKYYDFKTKIDFVVSSGRSKNTRPSFFNTMISSVKKFRPLIETYVLLNFRNLAIKMKGKYRQSEAYRKMNSNKAVDYIDFNLLGTPSLPLISNIRSSVDEVWSTEKEMEALYHSAIEKARL